MKPRLASLSHLKAINATAASWILAGFLSAILLGITAAQTRAGCNPADRIDAQCYPDLQTATAAALAANQPLWLPAGTYTLNQQLVIDYSPLAATGFQIISDGAIIDAAAIPTGAAVAVQCSGGTPTNPKGCFYFHIKGTLFVNANTTGSAVRVGLNDFSDAQNSIKIDHLVVNNGNQSAVAAVRLNYVLNASIFVVADSAGGTGMLLNQTQFSTIQGAASATGGTAMSISQGYTFANTFQALDLEVAQTCLSITSPYANGNTFVSPYFNCPKPIFATAGNSNMLMNPSYGAAHAPAPRSQIGILTFP
jgi:hypothetical protein